MDVIRSSGLKIPLNHPDYNKIKEKLTKTVSVMNSDDVTIINFFKEYDDHMLIPRFYPLNNDNIIDETCEGDDIVIESNVVPRSKGQADSIEKMSTSINGIVTLETGRGKTVTAIASICNIKKKTIILAHKDSLVENWALEILKHTNLTKDDIGILSNKKIDECLSKPIVVGTVQTLLYSIRTDNNEILDKVRNAGFGILVVDECHIGIGPEKFSDASFLFPVKRAYGLSATPERDFSNTTDIIHYHVGSENIYFESDSNEILDPMVFMYYFNFEIYKRYRNYFHFDFAKQEQTPFDYRKYYSMLRHSVPLKKMVCDIIKKSHAGGRNILVLSSFTNIIIELLDELKLEKSEVGIFSPSVKPKQIKKYSTQDSLKDAFANKRIVFSTYSMARDGNNRKNLDCLIMINATSNPTQAIGRVLRNMDDKRQPLVFQFYDLDGHTKNLNGKRVPFSILTAERNKQLFKTKNWNYKEIYLNNIKV